MKNCKITPFEKNLEIKSDYGARNWRKIQTVIDILQEPLDAQSARFQKEIFDIIGEDFYEASNSRKKEVFDGIQELHIAQNETKSQILETLNINSEKQNDLDKLHFKLPKLQLKLQKKSEGKITKKLIEYSDLKDYPEDWEIVGFRVRDSGFGFDHRVLGGLGRSVAKNNNIKRGGIGEGLKMSMKDAENENIKVRIASNNSKNLWLARPNINKKNENDKIGNLKFTGGEIIKDDSTPTDNLDEKTGSITDFDFSSEDVSSEIRETYREMLDFRKGEGIEKYILEFRGPEFYDITNFNINLVPMGVPEGRIYIRGLFIEDDLNMIGSYNFADKWSVVGGDRKSIDRTKLREFLKSYLEKSRDKSYIKKVLKSYLNFDEQAKCLEGEVLRKDFYFNDSNRKLWKSALEEISNFKPEKNLYIPFNSSDEDLRLCKENNYSPIPLKIEEDDFPFISNLYDSDSTVTLLDLKNSIKRKRLLEDDENVSLEVKQDFDDALKTYLTFRTQSNSFTFKIGNSISNHLNSKFKKLQLKTPRDITSSFYLEDYNILYINDDALPNNKTERLIFFFLEFLKIEAKEDTLYQSSQSILTTQITSFFKPKLPLNCRRSITLEKIGNEDYKTKEIYSQKNQEEDESYIKQINMYKQLMRTKTYQEALDTIKEIQDLVVTNESTKMSRILDGRILRLDNKFYEIDSLLPTRNHIELKLINRDNIVRFNGDKIVTHKANGRQFILKKRGDVCLIEEKFENKYTDIKNLWDIVARGIVFCGEYLYIRSNMWETKNVEKAHEVEEENEEKNFLSTSINIEYRKNIWQNFIRIFLDAIQNHIDADREKMPKIIFTMLGHNYKIKHLTPEAVEKLNIQDWDIIGVNIEDEGNGYNTDYLLTMGETTKGDDDLGKNGEGGKLLAASLIHQGVFAEFGSRRWIAHPESYLGESMYDHENKKEIENECLGYRMEWQKKTRKGSYSYFSVIPNLRKKKRLTKQEKKQLKQKGYNKSRFMNLFKLEEEEKDSSWKKFLEILDPRITHNDTPNTGIDRYLFPQKNNNFVAIDATRAGGVYENRLLITNTQFEKPPMIFGYNINATIVNTRERNFVDKIKFYQYIQNFYENLSDIKVVIQILQQAKNNPKKDFFEYKFLHIINRTLLRHAYYQVFGTHKILSLKSTIQLFSDEELVQSTQNEVHIDNETLVRLPQNITSVLLECGVYTSMNFYKEGRNSPDIEISEKNKLQILKRLQTINKKILTHLELLQNSEIGKTFLKKSIDDMSLLEDRIKKIKNMTINDFEIKSKIFTARAEIDTHNFLIKFNESLFTDPNFIGTYIHELVHYLSGQNDYTKEFCTMLIAFGLDIEKL